MSFFSKCLFPYTTQKSPFGKMQKQYDKLGSFLDFKELRAISLRLSCQGCIILSALKVLEN